MERFTEPSRRGDHAPLPPTFSRLSGTPFGVARDAAPAGPYFGPSGPAPRGRKRNGSKSAGTASGRTAGPDGDATARAAAVPARMGAPDRTAAHGAPLAPQPDDGGVVGSMQDPSAAQATGEARPQAAGRPSAPAADLATRVADRLERLALRLREYGDPRLAIATDTGEPLDSVIAGIVGDYLRDQSA